jgi:hypothetical protein
MAVGRETGGATAGMIATVAMTIGVIRRAAGLRVAGPAAESDRSGSSGPHSRKARRKRGVEKGTAGKASVFFYPSFSVGFLVAFGASANHRVQ